jgi:hypothetical protein
MKTQRERADEQRQSKLEDLERQVKDGSLTIRPMTPEERAVFPKPDRRRSKPGRP